MSGKHGVEMTNYYKLGKRDGIKMSEQGPPFSRKSDSIPAGNDSTRMGEKKKGGSERPGRSKATEYSLHNRRHYTMDHNS